MNAMMGTLAAPSPVDFSLWLIHWIGGTLWIVGAVLIVVWAVKYLPAAHLRSLGLWAFVVGILISVLTASAAAQGMQWLLASSHGMESGDAASMHSMMSDMMQRGNEGDALLHQEHEQILQSLRPSVPPQADGQ